MMEFSKNLLAAMTEQGMNQKELAMATGLSRASISLYASGKGIPGRGNIKRLADALGVSEDYLRSEPDGADLPEASERKVTVEQCARILGKSEQFVRIALQRGTAPFGFAAMMPSGKWCYHISPKKLTEYMKGSE